VPSKASKEAASTPTVRSAAKNPRNSAAAKRTRASALRKELTQEQKALSRERIVAVALEQIDRHGLAALSIREVARQLDVYPTAIYWHVPNRDALLAAVVEQTMSDVTPVRSDASWQDWIRELFTRYREAVSKHPNVAQLVGAQLVSNANLSPMLIERILSVLLTAGFQEDRLVDMYNVVIAGMVGFVTLEFAPLPTDDTANWAAQLRERVHSIRAMEFPTLARHLPSLANKAFIVRWQSGNDIPMESAFNAYVDVTIGGIERLLTHTRRTSSSNDLG